MSGGRRRLRFCFVASRDWFHPEAAGGDFYIGRLAQGLAERGHQIVFIASTVPGRPNRERVNNVEIVRLEPGPLYPLRVLFRFLRLRNSTDIMVEEVFGGKKLPPLAFLYAGGRSIAVWYQRHDKIFAEQYSRGIARILSLSEKILAKLYRSKPIVTLSKKSANELTQIGLDPARIGIVPSAALVPPQADEPPPFQDRQDTMIFIGKIRRYKRIDHAILALEMIVESGQTCRLVIAGNLSEDDLEYIEILKDLSRRLGVERQVEFRIYPGAIPPDEKMSLLKACKILLQPSPVEGFSMTTVEANSCGTPVVVSDGIPEDIVRHGENGLVYTFGDTDAMARSCMRLLKDGATWKRMSENGLKMAHRYSWDITTDAFEAFVKNQHW